MSLELINKYDDPAQVEVVKAETEKLSDHDKALYAADCVESLITEIKVSGWQKWLLQAAKVSIPLIIGAILGKYFPDIANLVAGFLG